MRTLFAASLVALLTLVLPACVPPYAGEKSNIDGQISKDLDEKEVHENAVPSDNGNLSDAARAERVPGHTEPVLALRPVFPALSSGQRSETAGSLLSISQNGTLLRWDLETGQAYQLYAGDEVGLRAVAVSASGELLALGSRDGIKIIDVRTGKVKYRMDRVRSRVHSLEFFPDEQSLLIGAVDGRVYRWLIHRTHIDTEVGDQRNRAYQRYIGHATVVSALAVHPEGRVFFSGDWAGMLFAWLPYDADVYEGEYDKNIFEGEFYSDLATRQQARPPAISNETGVRIDALAVSKDGNLLVVARESGDLELWKVRGFKHLVSTRAHMGHIRSLDVSPKGDMVVTYGRDNTVKVWKILQEYDEFLDEDKATLELAYEFKVPPSQKIVFVREQGVLAGTDRGTILEVDISKLPAARKEKSSSPKSTKSTKTSKKGKQK